MEARLSGYGFDGKLATTGFFISLCAGRGVHFIECESRAQTRTLDEEFAPHWGD